MYKTRLAVWIILITVFTAVFSKYIKFTTLRPDILFTFVLCFSILEKDLMTAMVVSAVLGAVCDCMSGRIFGNYMAVFLICAVIIYILKDCIYKNGFIFNVGLVFLVTLLGKSIFYVINISILKDAGYLYSFTNIILPEAFINAILSCIMLPVIKRGLVRRAGYLI